MEKVRTWCGQPSDRGRLKNRTDARSCHEGRVRRRFCHIFYLQYAQQTSKHRNAAKRSSPFSYTSRRAGICPPNSHFPGGSGPHLALRVVYCSLCPPEFVPPNGTSIGSSVFVGYCCYRVGSVAEWLACWTQAQKGPGSNRSRVTVLGKLFTPTVPLFTKQQNW